MYRVKLRHDAVIILLPENKDKTESLLRVLKFKKGEVILVDLPSPSCSLAQNLLRSCSTVERIWLSVVGCLFSPTGG